MSLYQLITRDGLSPADQKRLFADKMRLYRDALEHEQARWQADSALRDASDPQRDLQTIETLWTAFAATGVVERPTRDYAHAHFTGLDELERSNLRLLLRDTPDFAANLQREVTQALERLGVSATTTNGPLATKIVLEARAAAARACRLGVVPDGLAERLASGAAAPMAVGAAVPGTSAAAPLGPGSLTPEQVPEPWRSMSPTEVSDRMIAENPKMFEHRQSGKRATEQTGEQILRQIRWAARLLQMALPGRPMWTIAQQDIKIIDT